MQVKLLIPLHQIR